MIHRRDAKDAEKKGMGHRAKKAFELIREEAVERLTATGDYPGKLCEVSSEVDSFVINEMGAFREAERHGKKSSEQ